MIDWDKKLILIQVSNVRYRHPYYLKCDRCGLFMGGDNYPELVRDANNLHWRWDYENDKILCENCIEEERNEYDMEI